MLSDVGGGGLRVLWASNLFLLSKIGFVPWPKIMLCQALLSFLQEQYYKNKSLDFGKKNQEQAKNKACLAVPQNIRPKCLG